MFFGIYTVKIFNNLPILIFNGKDGYVFMECRIFKMEIKFVFWSHYLFYGQTFVNSFKNVIIHLNHPYLPDISI